MKLSEQLAAMSAAKPAPTEPPDTTSVEVTEVLATVGGLPAVDGNVQYLADLLSDLHSQKKEIEDKIKGIKTQLMDQVDSGKLAVGDTVETSRGRPAFSVRVTGRTFDPIKAATVLPAAVIESISTKSIDAKAAKAKLPPELYSKCQKDGRVGLVLR